MMRPQLTCPPEVAALLHCEYAAAPVILEYGSGGSTLIGAEMTGKRVFSVESDKAWLRKMQHWFDENPPVSPVVLHHGNIGRTRGWGHPRDESQWRRFLNYPLSVWERDDMVHPDLVLIDGRFRVGCFLATLMHITRPVRILFDDYADRKHFHVTEEFSEPTGMCGRMAIFDVEPRQPTPKEFGRWASLMQIAL